MAAGPQELEAFVKEALRLAPRGEIEAVLRANGWPPEQVRRALDGYAQTDFPVPVPRPRASMSAQEAFLYLLMFGTLYVSAYHLGSLFFDFINRAFPDPAAASWQGRSEGMRWSVSALLIAFPVFLYVSHLVERQLAQNAAKRLSPIRRWLTYLTLFFACSILIGDLISLVYNLLGGELTIRFVLKVASVGLIAGTILGYYLWDLRREGQEQ